MPEPFKHLAINSKPCISQAAYRTATAMPSICSVQFSVLERSKALLKSLPKKVSKTIEDKNLVGYWSSIEVVLSRLKTERAAPAALMTA